MRRAEHVFKRWQAIVPRELWARLFENATENIGILVYSAFFLPEQHALHIELLKQKADDGEPIWAALKNYVANTAVTWPAG